jgi:hypothetical protein
MKVLVLGSGRVYDNNNYVPEIFRDRLSAAIENGTAIYVDSDERIGPDFVKDVSLNNWWIDIQRMHPKFDYIVDTIGPGGAHITRKNEYCKYFKVGCNLLLELDGKFYGIYNIY